MLLDRGSFIGRLLFWSFGVLDQFTEKNRTFEVERLGTNLCQAGRVIFLYVPAVIILHLVLVAFTLGTLIGLPIYLFGGVNYSWVIGAIVGIGVATIVIIKATDITRYYFSNRTPKIKTVKTIIKKEKVKKVKSGPSLLSIFFKWMLASKQRICPTIKFKDEGNQS